MRSFEREIVLVELVLFVFVVVEANRLGPLVGFIGIIEYHFDLGVVAVSSLFGPVRASID